MKQLNDPNIDKYVQQFVAGEIDIYQLYNKTDIDATDLEDTGWKCEMCPYFSRFNRKLECEFLECLKEWSPQYIKLLDNKNFDA